MQLEMKVRSLHKSHRLEGRTQELPCCFLQTNSYSRVFSKIQLLRKHCCSSFRAWPQMHSFSCHRRPPGLASELSWRHFRAGSPFQLLWKERCWRPLSLIFLRTLQITSPKINHCILLFHFTMSWKKLPEMAQTHFEHWELSDSLCPFCLPQGPGGLALSSLDRKKHRHAPERNATLAWLMGSTLWLFTSNAQLAIHWMKTLGSAIPKEITTRKASQKSSWECVVAHPVSARCWRRDPHVVTGAGVCWYSASSGCGSILHLIETKL